MTGMAAVKRKWANIRHGLAVFVLAAVLAAASACAVPAVVYAADTAAAVMRIEKTEGTVEVCTSTGREVALLRNMRLYNGYEITTEEESYAWIKLDNSKLIKLDALSKAEIRKSGKKLEVLLKSGNLLFDVSEPLKEDESLNIRTSTMVMGIRGTSGWLEMINGSSVRLNVLEGTVQVSLTDLLTKQVKEDYVFGGEAALCVVYEEEAGGGRQMRYSPGAVYDRGRQRLCADGGSAGSESA